ncbi:hypothetical protein [Aneurinibacillus migulanus]|uniref:hypothetical protein n=1 Tax=Aneurinibacillus migulanus TaxID=47500 RepID=UPI00209EEFD8|nr:hypothetical protein [Aneurinibacillus migulanus]MCP1355344.1 hypothetical protein [Aneurinibacillus migulanus]
MLRVFKKIPALCLGTALIVGMSSNVLAQENLDQKPSQESISTIQKEFNLSKEEAVYYAELDLKVKQLEASGEKINLDDNSIAETSDEEIRRDPEKFKKDILALDKSALKKSFKSLNYLFDSETQMNQLMQENPDGNTYEIKYPDGSIMSANLEFLPRVDTNSDEVFQNSEPWTKSVNTGAYVVPEYNTIQPMRYVWEFKSSISIAKVSTSADGYVNTNKSNQKSKYSSSLANATGGASYAGVVRVDNYNSVLDRNYAGPGSTIPCQSWTQANMKVSGSFSANYAGLGISVDAGGGWTQYAIIRLTSDGIGQTMAATLQ